MTKVNLPKSGMGIEEGTIARWLKAVGETVRKGEIMAEVETAKALQEIAAPVTGVIVEILAVEGQTVGVNSCIALIDDNSAQ
jgi:pyruvate/2-oxoglutarate dehydrogenase complex dihydrolipoamide acyltransferase (E2) component